MAQLKARTELLRTGIKLEQGECLRGESVYFEVTLENISPITIQRLPDLSPANRALRLVVDDGKQQRVANQVALKSRIGVYEHAPEEPVTVRSAPGHKLTFRDDLLSWFGELPPGEYKVTAIYEADLHHAVSQPVKLKVRPAEIVLASTPRYGARGPTAPMAAAWAHKDGDGAALFYQHQAGALPRVAVHGFRVAKVKAVPAELLAATVPGSGAASGHLVWVDDKDRLTVAAAHIEKPRVGSGAQLDVPFKGRPLTSPLSMSDGGFFIPYADTKGQKAAIIQVKSGGDVRVHELDLGKAKPLGPYVCFWEYDARLNFAWATPGGREIQLARLPLDDPASGFATRSVYLADDPILWIDGYMDSDAQFREAPYFEEQIPPGRPSQTPSSSGPRLMLWCVTRSSAGLSCRRVNTTSNQSQQTAILTTSQADDLRIVSSAVTSEYELALLLADSKDQVYYASTPRGSVQPLADVAHKDVKLTDFPGLMAAGGSGAHPWVDLRYVEDGKMIEYVRLEPADEKDPVERETASKPSRRRGR